MNTDLFYSHYGGGGGKSSSTNNNTSSSTLTHRPHPLHSYGSVSEHDHVDDNGAGDFHEHALDIDWNQDSTRSHYHEFDTKPRPCQQLNGKTFLAVMVVMAVAVLWNWTQEAGVLHTNNHNGGSSIGEHTIPTLLHVVHHKHPATTNNHPGVHYVNALDNPLYDQLHRAKIVVHGSDNVQTGTEPPTLHVTPSEIQLRDPLTLSWTSGVTLDDATHSHNLQDEDILVLYCNDGSVGDPDFVPHRHDFLDAATIAQARATHVQHTPHQHHDDTNNDNDNNQWYFPSFPVLRHDVCRFVLLRQVHNKDDNVNNKDGHWVLRVVASSNPVHIAAAKTMPTAIHLALSDNPTEMVVQFVTGGDEPAAAPDMDSTTTSSSSRHGHHHHEDRYTALSSARTTISGTPVARYGLQNAPPSELITTKGNSHTYTAADLCQEPANVTEAGKFQSPGMIHVVRMTDLQPNQKYQYQVGLAHGQGITWSTETYTFVAPPVVGHEADDDDDSIPFRYIVYGDQGCPSNGWGNGSLWTAAMTARELLDDKKDAIRAVHHLGDLSYAKGSANVWQEWFHMIEPFSTRVPLMIAVGNHEYDFNATNADPSISQKDPSGASTPYHPVWGNFDKNDSGGECGVPTVNHFTMPNSTTNSGEPSNGVFWYSYDYGLVHTIVISSEHDLEGGSRQHVWLQADLASVNRTVTPWVIVEAHRPLYESEQFAPDLAVGIARRYQLDDLLHDYQVDIVFAGHYHSYLRTCDGLYNSKCNHGGPTHITIGSAGAALNDWELYDDSWTAKFVKLTYGYGRVTVANASALQFEFIKAGPSDDPTAGQVLDDVWVKRDRSGV